MKDLHLEIVRMEEREGVTSKQAYYKLRDLFGYSDKSHSVYRYWKAKNGINSPKYLKCTDCNEIKERRTGNQKSCNDCLDSRVKSCRLTNYKTDKYPVYGVWAGMWNRCTDPRSQAWDNYGKRGIRVCDEWQDYYAFGEWCMKNGWQEGLEIDRIDVNGNYCPENCRIVERWVNAANQRNRGSKTGYVGVRKINHCRTYSWKIQVKGERVQTCGFKNAKNAAISRDKYIIENDLPHTLNVLSRV